MKRNPWLLTLCISVILLCTVSFLLFKTPGKAPPKPPAYRVAAIMQTDANPFWSITWEGLRQAAPLHSLSVSEYPYQARTEIEALFETAILSQVDGVILCAPNQLSEHFAGLLAQARQKGIALVFVDSDVDEMYRDVFIGANNRAGGEMLADCVYEKWHQGDSIVLLASDRSSSFSIITRRMAFLERVEALGIADAVTKTTFRSDDPASLTSLQSMLLSGERPRHIVATSPGSTLSAAQIVDKLGLSEKVSVYGFSETKETLSYVERHTIEALISQQNKDMGVLAIQSLHALLSGETPPEREHYLPLYVLTPQNVLKSELAQAIRDRK